MPRNDIGRLTRMKGAHSDHRRLLRIRIARHNTLQCHDNCPSSKYGVNGFMWHSAMPARTINSNFNRIGGGHERSGPKTQLPYWQPRHVVHTEQRITGKSLQETIIQHFLRAPIAFFGGLKDDHQRTVELPAVG
ncbi:hypothetical protein D3C86_1854800 [compost metagenome]